MAGKRINKLISATLAAAMAVSMLSGCGATQTPKTDAVASEEDTKENETTAQDSESKVEDETADASATTDAEATTDSGADEETDNTEEAVEETTYETVMPEIINAHSATEAMLFGWNLGNTLDAFIGEAGKLRNDGIGTETCWGNPETTEELFELVKGTGVNVIRIPVTWYTHMDPNTYEIDSEWMDRVAQVVDYAMDGNTFVILNVHHDTGTDGWLHASETNLDYKKEVLASIWTQVATRFADYDHTLLFEGFNEILDDNNEWSNPAAKDVMIVNDLNQIFVDSVRATGSQNADRVLVVNTYCAGNTSKLIGPFKIPDDAASDAIIVEVHAYTPYYFTAPEYPDKKTWQQGDVKDTLSNVHTTFAAKNVPVIVGEFGAVPKNNEEDRQAWAKFFVETAAKYKMPCIWWDNGILTEYGIVDRKAMKIANEELFSIMIEAAKSGK